MNKKFLSFFDREHDTENFYCGRILGLRNDHHLYQMKFGTPMTIKIKFSLDSYSRIFTQCHMKEGPQRHHLTLVTKWRHHIFSVLRVISLESLES